ncbi:uncharacterized protein LOC119069436 [Bradysia coprophila]|uniref:uncharacterized protein LOC119069436 n=1 Tax=Bradysia coprophila TaxID=38358 RepID=UPI00187DBAC0|nr:uncharacterized protein LOC119069436 [Bradysia coprophila]
MILSGLLCSILLVLLFGITTLAENGLHQHELLTQLKVPQCREMCIEQFNIDDLQCLERTQCLECWNSCAATSEQSTLHAYNQNTNQLDAIKVHIHSMIRDGSLTSADITWTSVNEPSQCLVTWEVSGGGLMGNLLTDTPDAQLSLWPDTKYRMQVTCKNKVTGTMSKSMPIIIDTSDATKLMQTSTSTDVSTVINHSLSGISQSSVSPIHQSLSPVANPDNNGPTETPMATTTVATFINPKNIKVITPRYQNAASTKNSKSHANISPTGLAAIVCVLLMLFLVMSSVCLVKQRRKTMECDKKMLIGTNDLVHSQGSECELNITKRNIYLV